METALLYDRLQFAFTLTFHYLFPQLTMGLAGRDRVPVQGFLCSAAR
jgi:hypothetical protein